MCIYSKFWVNWEKKSLAPYAIHSDHPWYSDRSDQGSAENALDSHGSRSRYRTAFELDKDRITNSQAFRRLEYKTQVFVTHEGDNYRTRLTHSLEVSEIARHIARALRLNEHLVEAIALGHDLGHAPYGHIAEKAINKWVQELDGPFNKMYYFCHNRHSVENVEHLEPGYDWDSRKENEGMGQGLNLTLATREGILVHANHGFRGAIHKQANFTGRYEDAINNLNKFNKEKNLFYPGTLEAQVVRISDDIAQRIHDLEDGLRSGMLIKDNIVTVIKEFIPTIKEELGGKKLLDSEKPFCVHPKFKTKIPKVYLYHIVEMLDQDADFKDTFGHVDYNQVSTDGSSLNIIKNKCSDPKYHSKMTNAAIVSFLLHMWRDKDSLTKLDSQEQTKSRTRVLKYLNLLNKITTSQEPQHTDLPAYHLIAFLRGIMLANVIEHSYRAISCRLNPKFNKFSEDKFCDEVKEKIKTKILNGQDVNEAYYLAFVIVDGIIVTDEDGKKMEYKTRPEEFEGESVEDQGKVQRFFLYKFASEQEMNDFLRNHLKKVFETNGAYLKNEAMANFKQITNIETINWLNKSEDPELTQYLKLSFSGESCKIVPLERMKIIFTGYGEKCPGPQERDNSCKYSRLEDIDCMTEKCPFWKKENKYPDINMIVSFHDYVKELDLKLKKMITKRMHNSSRVARMNYMGEKIIRFILNEYKTNPRLMHDRVWSRLRSYKELEGVSKDVGNYLSKRIVDREKDTIPKEILDKLTRKKKQTEKWRADRYSLIRRIIEHVAGMTDRYISNEYNRLNQSGRETELQDETYFFS